MYKTFQTKIGSLALNIWMWCRVRHIKYFDDLVTSSACPQMALDVPVSTPPLCSRDSNDNNQGKCHVKPLALRL